MTSLYLTSTEALAELCQIARSQGRVAVDTEFHRERRYFPQLALVQLAVEGREALLDPLDTSIDFAPLGSLLAEPDVVKVLHAPSQDLEIFYLRFGNLPRNVFDTQIAAAMLGLGAQVSLAGLVDKVLGIHLAKGQSFTDWLRRPLTESQELYAAADVRHLLALHDALLTDLQELGRAQWLFSEFARFEDEAQFSPAPAGLFQKVKRYRSLDPRRLAVLRELAIWREDCARARDRNRRSVASDEVLLELARSGPRSTKALGRVRGLHPEAISRQGAEIIAAVERGMAVPDDECPRLLSNRPTGDGVELAAAIVLAFLKVYCKELRIDPSMIGNASEVERLVADYADGALDEHREPLLNGWRGELVGSRILAFLRGELAVRMEPGTARPVFEPVSA